MKSTRVKVRRRPDREPWRPEDWPPFWRAARWVGLGLIVAAFVLGVTGIADAWREEARQRQQSRDPYGPGRMPSYVVVRAERPSPLLQNWQVTLTRQNSDGYGSTHLSGGWGGSQAYLYVEPGRYGLQLEPPHQFSRPRRVVHVFEGTNTEVEVHLTPPGALGGRIFDVDGNAVPGATLTRPPPDGTEFDPDQATTDDRGTYHFTALGTETSLDLVVKAGDRTIEVEGVRLIPGGACRLNLRLGPASRVVGVLPNGIPSPTTIHLAPRRVNRAGRVLSVLEQHEFEFVHPPDQNCLVLAHGTAPDGTVRVATANAAKAGPGETVTVADWTQADGTLEWRMADRQGPVAPSGMTLRWDSAAGGAWWEARVRPGADGFHRVIGLPPGRVTFAFARAGAPQQVHSQTVDYDGGDAKVVWDQ